MVSLVRHSRKDLSWKGDNDPRACVIGTRIKDMDPEHLELVFDVTCKDLLRALDNPHTPESEIARLTMMYEALLGGSLLYRAGESNRV